MPTPSAEKLAAHGWPPAKPDGSPIYPHAGSGYWCKTIDGKRRTFGGRFASYREAFDEYCCFRADPTGYDAGDGSSPSSPTTVGDVVNGWLASREVSEATMRRYKREAAQVIEFLGRRKRVAALAPMDFESMLRRRGGYGTGKSNFVTTVRMIFGWAADADLAPHVKFGRAFKVTKQDIRRDRAKHDTLPKVFEVGEVAEFLRLATDPVTNAMIRLGISAAFTNMDIAGLRARDLKQRSGHTVIDTTRGKTGIARFAVLSPATAAALETARQCRPDPADAADGDRIFLTRFGLPVVRETGKREDAVRLRFDRLRKKAGSAGDGRGFSTLRTTFRSIAGGAGIDSAWIKLAMGHEHEGVEEHYVRITDQTVAGLAKLSAYVEAWMAA